MGEEKLVLRDSLTLLNSGSSIISKPPKSLKFCSTNEPHGACCNTLNSFINYGFGPEKMHICEGPERAMDECNKNKK